MMNHLKPPAEEKLVRRLVQKAALVRLLMEQMASLSLPDIDNINNGHLPPLGQLEWILGIHHESCPSE